MKKKYQTLLVMIRDIWKEYDNFTKSELKNYFASMNEELIEDKRFNKKVLKYFFSSLILTYFLTKK